MKTSNAFNLKLRLGIVAAMFFTVISVQANPIALPEKPVTPEISFLIAASILLEAICWVFLLRRFQKPRWFILWVLGMHLLTFPAFIGLLRFLDTMRPAIAVAVGEGLVVLVEGYLVFLICGYVRPSLKNAPTPSLVRCWLVSLVGNVCSATAFPLLKIAHDLVFSH
jgi:hypothetical protein